MILASAKEIERYTAQGLWGKVQLDGLLQRRAVSDPDRVALVDPPNRAAFATGPARTLTFGQCWQVVGKLSAALKSFGLVRGDIVGIQMPPIVEAPLVLLACWHAGLVASPLPVPWRAGEITHALNSVAARALVTWGSGPGNQRLNDLCRAGASIASVRAVMAFGQSGTDGVIGLDAVVEAALEEAVDLEIAEDEAASNPADEPNALATLTWDISTSADADVAAARSHNEWIAAGIATVLGAGLGENPTIVCPYPLNGLVPIGALMVPWLMNGGTLVLHRPFDLDVMCGQLAQTRAHFTCLPPEMARQLASEIERRQMSDALKVLGVHWRSQNPVPRDAEASALRWLDVVNLAEIALVFGGPQADQSTLPMGTGQSQDAPGTCEIRLAGANQDDEETAIEVRSPMAPSARLTGQTKAGRFTTATDDEGFMQTGLYGRQVEAGKMRLADVGEAQVRHGGLALSLDELDELYKSHQSVADAAALTQPDDVMGQRLIAAIIPAGDGDGLSTLTLPEFTAHLHALGVAAYKHPDQLVIVEKIPRDGNGNIDRDKRQALIKSNA